ncbi:MAG: efflux RND transporter periplasmic adaptor subunit [Bacteroidetes bacterium]|jgi:cobalt-zinc-cadmium efflux system membrane fusion protein|nr:efflux RND transporter periplasmic adaptor subunit [Bacteroidota bacterium]
MNLRIIIIAVFAIMLAACNQQNKTEALLPAEHEEHKFQYTAYSNDFELFAEADVFVVGETANVLSHFSVLPDFKALENGSIKLVLTVNGKETSQTLEKPTRKGIYSFNIKPEASGTGSLTFEVNNENGSFEISVPQVIVFTEHQRAHQAAVAGDVQRTNTTVFTKEQSWKIDFSTGYPTIAPFGEVIKTTALVQASQGSEVVVSARIAGIVHISNNSLLEGKEVTNGQSLCTITGSNMAENNISVRFAEAQNNYERAKADYERAQELAKDKIVSDKDLMASKNHFENSKANYQNLNRNFSSDGQTVKSPMRGFLKQVFVKKGTYVEAGQAILTVSQNRTLTLTADLPLKYASALGTIQSANIRTPHDNQTYTFDQLNGKVLAYGKSAEAGSYLVPITLQIDNIHNFIPGSFVEVYLKTLSNTEALTVPVSALLEEQGSFFVWVQVSPELFEKRLVATGKTDGVQIEIVKGLHTNERIVTLGSMMLKLAQATGTLDAHSGHVH